MSVECGFLESPGLGLTQSWSVSGGGGVPAALHLPWSRVSAGGDGGAGPGGPSGCVPGTRTRTNTEPCSSRRSFNIDSFSFFLQNVWHTLVQCCFWEILTCQLSESVGVRFVCVCVCHRSQSAGWRMRRFSWRWRRRSTTTWSLMQLNSSRSWTRRSTSSQSWEVTDTDTWRVFIINHV